MHSQVAAELLGQWPVELRRVLAYLDSVEQGVINLETRDSLLTADHANVLSVLAVGHTPAIGAAGGQRGLPACTVDIVQPDFACRDRNKRNWRLHFSTNCAMQTQAQSGWLYSCAFSSKDCGVHNRQQNSSSRLYNPIHPYLRITPIKVNGVYF